MKFKDYFSKQAAAYTQFRPTYPKELFDYIAALPKQHHCAWDCGTGNGQAAVELANYFDHVIATDASPAQIENAKPRPNVIYKVMPAEKTDIPDHSIDLITVAQALHWFDFPKFYAEVRRVLKSDGYLAAWTYPFLTFENLAIQSAFLQFVVQDLKEFWAKERAYCDNYYRDIPFELTEIPAPEFFIMLHWNFDQLIGYLSTFSPVQKYKDKYQQDPIKTLFLPVIEKVWLDKAKIETAKLEIALKVGKI